MPNTFRKPVDLEVNLLHAVSYNHWTRFYLLVVGDVFEMRKERQRTETATEGLTVAGELCEFNNQLN
jgi:hypothetical protein